ncbi:hydrophobin 2 [Lentinula raphanica]|uniref:Hydrophobin n=1 Tax=Lentinula raphanica TaxID=153919 RepID=A0AA38PK94_9AGAR|nr:hydrophobin 2 [Lentinula raphanica]
MQFKLAFVSAVLATLAVATPTPETRDEPASSCSTGDLQCCNSVQPATSTAASSLLALGIVLQDVNVAVGITCSPISVIGVLNGNSCNAQAVSAAIITTTVRNIVHISGLVSLGCVPVQL